MTSLVWLRPNCYECIQPHLYDYIQSQDMAAQFVEVMNFLCVKRDQNLADLCMLDEMPDSQVTYI